jgi:hypothetical protein
VGLPTHRVLAAEKNPFGDLHSALRGQGDEERRRRAEEILQEKLSGDMIKGMPYFAPGHVVPVPGLVEWVLVLTGRTSVYGLLHLYYKQMPTSCVAVLSYPDDVMVRLDGMARETAFRIAREHDRSLESGRTILRLPGRVGEDFRDMYNLAAAAIAYLPSIELTPRMLDEGQIVAEGVASRARRDERMIEPPTRGIAESPHDTRRTGPAPEKKRPAPETVLLTVEELRSIAGGANCGPPPPPKEVAGRVEPVDEPQREMDVRFARGEKGIIKPPASGLEVAPRLEAVEAPERMVNVWLDGAEEPLLVGRPYRVGIDVGRAREMALATRPLAEPEWEEEDELDLLIVLSGDDVQVDPPFRPAKLHRRDGMPAIFFDVTPIRGGRPEFFVSILLARELLLQKIRIVLHAVAEEAATVHP